jgi:magnesium chelatase subunit I
MRHFQIKTLGQLKGTGYKSKPIKDELRDNLISRLKNKDSVFTGIWGYEETVIPDLERAILAGHDINLLGLRGQAKTRLARLMVNLLDEYIPIIEGSELNDDPLAPISRHGKDAVRGMGMKHQYPGWHGKIVMPKTCNSRCVNRRLNRRCGSHKGCHSQAPVF